MVQPSIPHSQWWNKEFSRPMLSVSGLKALEGAKEYAVLVANNRRLVCKATLLPKKKAGDPMDRWCDVITGAVYTDSDHRFHGKPTPTGRGVPSNSVRLLEAKTRATVPFVVTGVESD